MRNFDPEFAEYSTDRLPAKHRRRYNRFDDDERRNTGRLTKEQRQSLAQQREEAYAGDTLPYAADRWSTWDSGERGPLPYPSWVVTELAAVDTELGVLKTGKEADVHLIRRGVPDTNDQCLLAAKRYRDTEHRQFHRDAGYLEGRRMRRSREMRAMNNRTAFGRNLIAQQWAIAEFSALSSLWTVGAPVPYPVQRNGTEILLEFIGNEEGVAAQRLAQTRMNSTKLRELWHRIAGALDTFAALGLTHGDLSAYNVMVHEGQPVLIDLPQVVDIISNPRGEEFLARDVHNIAAWFRARGVDEGILNVDDLLQQLRSTAGCR